MKIQKTITLGLEEIQALVANAYTDHGLIGSPIRCAVDESFQLSEVTLSGEPSTRALRGSITFTLLDRPVIESK